jgi:hypothetical protein
MMLYHLAKFSFLGNLSCAPNFQKSGRPYIKGILKKWSLLY